MYFSEHTVLAPEVRQLLSEKFSKRVTTADTPSYLRDKGVSIEGSLLRDLLPILKPHSRGMRCKLIEYDRPFSDDEVDYNSGFSLHEFWFVVGIIMTRFVNKEAVHYIDELPVCGVVMYVALEKGKRPMPINIYREEKDRVLRVRPFPYGVSLWDAGTKVFTK